MKKGFTLHELLIAMAIVGTLAVLAGAAYVKIKPDANKRMYIKAYNTVSQLTQQILDDSSLYYPTNTSDGQLTCAGLHCDSRPIDTDKYSESYTGENKYPLLLCNFMNTMAECSADTTTFTTTDGIQWSFATTTGTTKVSGRKYNGSSYSDDVSTYNIVITLNLKPSKGNNADNIFTLNVDNDGAVTPGDAKGRQYLQTIMETANNSTVFEK